MSIYFDITVALTKLCLLFILAAWRLFYQCHSTKKYDGIPMAMPGCGLYLDD